MTSVVDLRSDTVTRPTTAMRAHMANAVVGDDVFGEDPTARLLETRVAEMLGKEAALFVPSGTMANQIALQLHCRRGDEVIVGEGAHCAYYESGAGGALAGVQFAHIGRGGLFTKQEVQGAIRPIADWYPRTRLVAMENTHNRGGGKIFPYETLQDIAEFSKKNGLFLHLDGARLWNAVVATGRELSQWAQWFDSVSVCLSKGLGAPVGSLLVSDRERITEARRLRKMLGGGMRQVGLLAAAGLYAIDHHVKRLEIDHEHAMLLHAGLQAVNRECVGSAPETNIVMVDINNGTTAEVFASRAKEQGVLVSVFGPTRIRVVTHLDVTREQIDQAVRVLGKLVSE